MCFGDTKHRLLNEILKSFSSLISSQIIKISIFISLYKMDPQYNYRFAMLDFSLEQDHFMYSIAIKELFNLN